MPVSRRQFVGLSLGAYAASLGPLTTPGARAAQPEHTNASGEMPWSPVTADADARVVVGASHSNLDLVREMVTVRPNLALATIDGGFGDWETALGAASHVGRRDIAEFLIAHGARPDLFTFAMLGNLAAVRAAIEAAPGLQRLKGPHGLTLAHHARAGGEAAAPVAEYLDTLEGADEAVVVQPVDNPSDIIGAYTLVSGGAGMFTVAEGRRALEFQMEPSFRRNLLHMGGLEFHPPGVPAVRFRFTPATTAAEPARVVVVLGDRRIEAIRHLG